MAHDVFICHSSKDKKIADAICAKLEQHKIRCWIAPRDVVPGSDFAESIVQAIHTTKVTVFVFSANSNVSPHVKHELERTVSLGLPVLPFRVDDVVPSPALEYFISSAHWLDALTPPLEQHIDRLVTTVEALLQREVVPQEQVATAPTGAPGSRRWIAVAVGAALVLGAVAVGLVLALGRGQGGETGSQGTTAPTPTATSSRSPSAGTGPFTDGFTGAVGSGWTWQNEDPTSWRVTPKGWLEIDPQSSPPFHNLLLRDAPGATYKVKLRLRLPPTTNGFAGLVLTADDPETRLQFGWGQEGLEVDEYRDGNITAGVRLDNKDLHVTADRTSELFLEISGGIYRARYLDPSDGSYWDVNTGALDPAFTHVGLIAYRTGAGGTAAAGFDRIEFY
jgi:hypothetical protein